MIDNGFRDMKRSVQLMIALYFLCYVVVIFFVGWVILRLLGHFGVL